MAADLDCYFRAASGSPLPIISGPVSFIPVHPVGPFFPLAVPSYHPTQILGAAQTSFFLGTSAAPAQRYSAP